MVRVLYVGDHAVAITRSVVGVDVIEEAAVADASTWLRRALAPVDDIAIDHLAPQAIPTGFPDAAGLARYDVVLLSDVGYGSFVLPPAPWAPPGAPGGAEPPGAADRTVLLRRFVEAGGGLVMAGGYLSFAGWHGVARWAGTAVEAVLPVRAARHDDRVEVAGGFRFALDAPDHPIVRGLPWEAPWSLRGYNRVTAAPGAAVLASHDGDPLLACTAAGRGRTVAFASDVAPHWADGMVGWAGYAGLWSNVLRWAAGTT